MNEGRGLTDDELREAVTTVIELGVERETLLLPLAPWIQRRLRSRSAPRDQILGDVFELRRLGAAHLRAWMEQAAFATAPHDESARFERWRDELEGYVAAQEKRRPPWTRGVWVGREEEMTALEEAFADPPHERRPVAIVALQGMGGIGKTYSDAPMDHLRILGYANRGFRFHRRFPSLRERRERIGRGGHARSGASTGPGVGIA